MFVERTVGLAFGTKNDNQTAQYRQQQQSSYSLELQADPDPDKVTTWIKNKNVPIF